MWAETPSQREKELGVNTSSTQREGYNVAEKKNNSSWQKNKSRSCFATQGSSKVTTVINSLFEVKCHQIRIKKIVWQFSGSRISKPFPQQKNKQLESVMVYSRCSSSSPAAMQREAVLHIVAQVDSAADWPAPEPAQPPAYCAALVRYRYLPHGPSGKVTGITTHGHWDWSWYSRHAGMWPCSVRCTAAWEIKQLRSLAVIATVQ